MENSDPDSCDSYIIKKFQFNSFDEDSYKEINKSQSNNIFNNRIISAFSMDDYNILIVFFVLKTNTVDRKDYGKYCIRFYDYDLNLKKEKNLTDELTNLYPGSGLFFKSFYLKEKFAAFIYFTDKDNGRFLTLKIMELSENDNYDFTEKKSYNIDIINFNIDIYYSDFLKIDEKRIIDLHNGHKFILHS